MTLKAAVLLLISNRRFVITKSLESIFPQRPLACVNLHPQKPYIRIQLTYLYHRCRSSLMIAFYKNSICLASADVYCVAFANYLLFLCLLSLSCPIFVVVTESIIHEKKGAFSSASFPSNDLNGIWVKQ